MVDSCGSVRPLPLPRGTVRPEQLRDRQWRGLVEVDACAEEVVVPTGMHGPDGHVVAVEDVSPALVGLELPSRIAAPAASATRIAVCEGRPNTLTSGLRSVCHRPME